MTFGPDTLDAVTAATLKFADEVKDPKAQIITTYNSIDQAR